MIPPAETWAIQIEVTTACPRRCSNCTRMIAMRETEHMDIETFRRACRNVADFPGSSPPSAYVPRMHKCIGMIGGEPIMHPAFAELCQIMAEEIPDAADRGLWTGLPARLGVDSLFGYINRNEHRPPCQHQPILVASRELMPDDDERAAWINRCWINRYWSPIVTRAGVYFCEVAATIDELFDLHVARPDEPGWWREPLAYWQDQIDACCVRCGCAMPLPTRADAEVTDDVSVGNLNVLLDSGATNGRSLHVWDCEHYEPDAYLPGWEPRRYMR
jgi:hypothetical protein